MKKQSRFFFKKQIFFISLLIGLVFLVSYLSSPSITLTSYKSCEVCFSPHMFCTNRIIHYIENSKKDIFVQAFVLTSKTIAESLISAFRRGVTINIILDGTQIKTRHSLHQMLLDAGIPVSVDKIKKGYAHNKVMIFDGEVVLTGSFNFSKSAETTNAENVLFLKDKTLAHHYLKNWHRRFKVSRPLS